MTTQAIIETIPKEATQSSDISDHELKEPLPTNTTPPEALLVPESEPETEGEPSSDVTLVEVKEEEHEEDQEPEESDCKYSIYTDTSFSWYPFDQNFGLFTNMFMCTPLQ